MVYAIASWVAVALSMLCLVGLTGSVLMLVTEPFDWSTLAFAGVFGIGGLLASLASAELAADGSQHR